jgi:hypothetical protein
MLRFVFTLIGTAGSRNSAEPDANERILSHRVSMFDALTKRITEAESLLSRVQSRFEPIQIVHCGSLWMRVSTRRFLGEALRALREKSHESNEIFHDDVVDEFVIPKIANASAVLSGRRQYTRDLEKLGLSTQVDIIGIAIGAGFAVVGTILLGLHFIRPRASLLSDLPRSPTTELIAAARNDLV